MVKNLKTYNECLEDGLLRRIPISRKEAENSLKTAYKWLNEAEKNLNAGALNSSAISSYLAMFHASRAILFRDGFREKSHYCIARFLEDNYVKKKKLEEEWVLLLDHYRGLRHDDQYGTDFYVTTEEAGEALSTANRFVERMEKLFLGVNS
jgi:uncharacterized protein (UPF0332 family)